MLDESHINVAGQQREFDLAQFIERPTLAAATGGDGFVPDCCDFVAQRIIADGHDVGEELGDVVDCVGHDSRIITVAKSKTLTPALSQGERE